MIFHSSKIVLILILSVACQFSPHSKWNAQLAEDDKLTDQQKIDFLTNSTTELSATRLAAIARLYENQLAWPQAMSAIKLAIREDPMNSSYHSLKANYAYAMGQKSVAYREALTAYQLGSKSLQQSLDLAKMGVALSEFSIVNNIIDSLLVVYPQDPDVLYMTARKFDKTGDYISAGRYYSVVNEIAPENWENTFNYCRLLISQDSFLVAKNVLKQLPIEISSKQLYMLGGDVYFGLENYDSAAYFYYSALGQSVDTVTYNRLLHSYSLIGNYDSIINLSIRAIAQYPENKNYQLLCARTLDKKNRFEESLQHYLTLYEQDSLDTVVMAELSYLKRKIAYLQRKREAEKQLTDSVKIIVPVSNI